MAKVSLIENYFHLQLASMPDKEYEDKYSDGPLSYGHKYTGTKPKTEIHRVQLKKPAFSSLLTRLLHTFPKLSEDIIVWYLLELGISRQRYEKRAFDYFEAINSNLIIKQVRKWEVIVGGHLSSSSITKKLGKISDLDKTNNITIT